MLPGLLAFAGKSGQINIPVRIGAKYPCTTSARRRWGKVDAVAKEKNDVAELDNFEEMVARRR